MLREAEVRLSQGQTIGAICKGFGISEQSYYRWRRAYGGLKIDHTYMVNDFGLAPQQCEAHERRFESSKDRSS